MKKSLRHLISMALTAVLVAVPVQGAFGQHIKVTAGEPVFDELFSPQFDGVSNKRFESKAWLEIEAPLLVQMAPEPPSKSCDKLTVKWFLAVENPGRSGTFLLLTKDIDYVNVPLGQEIYVSTYLSPVSVNALLGKNRKGPKMVELVGYEVHHNGQKVAESTNKQKPGWWNVASPKVARSEVVSLMAKPETPFSGCWWDRYAQAVLPKQ